MALKLANNARSLLSASISLTDTLVRVRAGHGARFPAIIDPDDWFPLALENEFGEIEYLRCIGRSGDTFTVQRGQEGSQPRAYTAGDACELRLTALAAQELMGAGGNTLPAASVGLGLLEELL
ncbi:MAG: hypothetical protein VYD90_10680 [Pseudomonadota bacterium]|nr:hypothetical protein [Pseudomonadota bacterium]